MRLFATMRSFPLHAGRTLALTCLLGAVSSPPAGAEELRRSGKPGATSTAAGACKYRVFGSNGILETSVAPPVVRGANVHRRKRNEATTVRYRAYLVDVANNHEILTASDWSDPIRVRQRQRRTWTGTSAFTGDWRGNYRIDLWVEWWSKGRRVGWRDLRVAHYNYFDQYNVGPFGPMASCYKVDVQY